MRVVLTDEILDFYAEEFVEKQRQGIIRPMTFVDYFEINFTLMNIKMEQAKERNKRVKEKA